MVSIHAPHEGERHFLLLHVQRLMRFNPRSPRGGATAPRPLLNVKKVRFNPRSPRGGATSPA